MKTAIIYTSNEQLTPMHQILQPTRRAGNTLFPVESKEIWIRMEITHEDPVEALGKATPMDGETVLNSIRL